MSLETALRAVDFFMERSSGVEEVTIGFYGGEPVLEFELIKQVVQHVESRYPARKVRFNFTTNLTLFTDEIMDYVLEKNIHIMISIDGPQAVQDKYRTSSTGKAPMPLSWRTPAGCATGIRNISKSASPTR